MEKLRSGRQRRRYRLIAQSRLGASLVKTGGYLMAIFAAHTLAMIQFEGFAPGDALWLTLTTATTVGYGDLSAHTLPGRIATVMLLYTGGIFVVAKLAGDYFDYRNERRLRMTRGEWEWDMRDHIVIINAPEKDPVHYFELLIAQFRESQEFATTPVQILSPDFSDGLPASLVALGDVVHYAGSGAEDTSLESVGVADARAIVCLSRSDHDPAWDSVTFDILHRLQAIGTHAEVLAECVRDSNRVRFMKAGAHIVIRPIRAYPGMVVRGFVAPGAQSLMEELFRSDGSEYRRLSVEIVGAKWADVVASIVQHDHGVAIAYEDGEGGLHISPRADDAVNARALFVVVDSHISTSSAQIEAALADLSG
jgi:voltage-gated potassium channel